MYFYIKPKEKISAESLRTRILSAELEYKVVPVGLTKQSRYISSVVFFNRYQGEDVNIHLDINYQKNGEVVEFLVLYFYEILNVKEEDIIKHLKDLVYMFSDICGESTVYDLWAGQKVASKTADFGEAVLLNMCEYRKNTREVLDSYYARNVDIQDKEKLSIYRKLLEISNETRGSIGQKNSCSSVLSQILKTKDVALRKYYIFSFLNFTSRVFISSSLLKTIATGMKFDYTKDIDLYITLSLADKEVCQYVDTDQQIMSEKIKLILRRENKPPPFYILLSYYYIHQKQYAKFLEVCIEGYKKYEINELKQLLEQEKIHFGFKQKLGIIWLTQGWFMGFYLIKYIIPFIFFFSLPLLVNVVTSLLFILPVVLSSQTLTYTINRDMVIGLPSFLVIVVIFLSLFFAIFREGIRKLYYENYMKAERQERRLYIAETVLMIVMMLCNLCPSMYVATKSLAYIQEEKISGNTFVAELDNMAIVELKVIEPVIGEEYCPFITELSTECSYSYEINVTEKNAHKRTFFAEHICSSEMCTDMYIFKDVSATDKFIDNLIEHKVRISTNYTAADLANYQIPDLYKESLGLFIKGR